MRYVGNRGTHLLAPGWSSQSSTLAGQQFDGIPNQYLSPLLVRDQATINHLTQAVSNPFYPLLPGTNLSAPTVGLSQLLLPYPQFTGLSIASNAGFSWFHSMQTQVQRRLSKGFTIMGSWTWSKNMEAIQFLNAGDARPSRVISPNDRTHRFVVNGIYELPFGQGRAFGAGRTGAVGKLIGGWQIESSFQHQTGDPLGFGNFIFNGNPNTITLPISQRGPAAWFNTAGFDRATADQLADNVIYQSLRFSGIRADGLTYLDFSVIKKTKIKERFTADFRAEAFNALNHTVFLDPIFDADQRHFRPGHYVHELSPHNPVRVRRAVLIRYRAMTRRRLISIAGLSPFLGAGTPAPAEATAQTVRYRRIRTYLDSIPAIDTHDHLRPFDRLSGYVQTERGMGMNLFGLLSTSYYQRTNSLTPWKPGQSFNTWWAQAKHDFDNARATGVYRYLLTAFHDLYGVDFDNITDSASPRPR